MKVKEDLILKEIAGENVVVPVGSLTVDMRCMIKLNSVGAFLWKKLTSDITREQLLSALTEEYDVSDDDAARDLDAFIEKLQTADLLQ
ncbi:MAG: PqqD family protein [Oscillospiraceae bacterium]|jgi:hypothetical protein|nr:PqqD family protein [Oscillospiraceae bacterium]